jgi:glycosyltransferase involved in cell wall biosynthesis
LYAAVRDIITCVPGAVVELVGEPGVGWAAPPPSCAANIRLCGRLDSDAVRQKMREARVLVAPSIWPEPLSRVLLEAMSVGLPIVAAAVGGSVEALDADSAVLIPPDDAAALASAVCRILQDDAYADRLSAAAAARYDRLFTAEHVVPALLDVYRQAL